MTIKTYRYWEPVLDLRVFRGFPAQVIPDLRWRVMSFELIDSRGLLDKATLVLDNNDGKLFNLESLALGIFFKISFGYPDVLAPPRVMQCRKLNGAIRLGGLGEDSMANTTAGGAVTLELASQVWELNFQRALQSIEGAVDRELLLNGVTIPDAVRAIGRRYGYDGPTLIVEDLPEERIIEKASIPAKFSVYEWIKNEAKKRHFIFDIDSDGFHFHSDTYEAAISDGHIEDLTWFLGDPDVIEWSLDGDLNVPQGVEIRGTNARVENVYGMFTQGMESGQASLVPAVFRDSGKSSGKSNKRLSPNLLLTTTARDAHLDRLYSILSKALRRWVLKMKLVGNPFIRRGRKIRLKNFGPMIDGIWFVQKCRHSIEPNQVYITELDAIRRFDKKAAGKNIIVGEATVGMETGEAALVPVVFQGYH